MGKSYIFIKDFHGLVLYIHSMWRWVSFIYSLKIAIGKSYIFFKDAHGEVLFIH